MFRLAGLILALLFASTILAQGDDCPALVRAALETVDTICADTGRNQACYGNALLEATPRDGVSDFVFEQAGDLVDVANIQSLQLSSMSLTDQTWGISLLQLQARVPDTLPGQSITFLMFGDVQIASASSEITLTASSSTDVRPNPSADATLVLASLTSGQEVVATGRLDDSSWVRIVLPDDESSVGWVPAQALDSDLSALAVIEPEAPRFGPMHAFYFASGVNDRPCDEAPDSGILIQTSQGAGKVSLLVNEVDIELGSTAYVQAGGGFMTVSVLEGGATLEAFGVTQVVPAGTFAQVPLDANGIASGAPTSPQPYVSASLAVLPVTHLPQTITIAPPLTADQIGALNVPASGPWLITFDFEEIDLGCMSNSYGPNGSEKYIFVGADGSISWNSVHLVRVGTGVYEGEASSSGAYPSTQTYRLAVVSPGLIIGQDVWSAPHCSTIVNNFRMELVDLLTPTPSSQAADSSAASGDVVPLSGDWCPQPTGCTANVLPTTMIFTAEEGGAFLTLDYGTSAERYSRTEPGVYTWTNGSSTAVLHVLAADHITITYDFGTGTATYEWKLLETGDNEDIIPTAGRWQHTWEQNEVDTGQCVDTFANGEVSLTVNEDGSITTTVFPPLPKASPGVYILEQGTARYTFRVLSAESIEGDYEVFAFNCAFTNHFQMTLISTSP